MEWIALLRWSCFGVCLLTIVLGVGTGLWSVWGSPDPKMVSKAWETIGFLFAGASVCLIVTWVYVLAGGSP